MVAAGKPNKGHENVRKHTDKSKDEALDRLNDRVDLFKRLVLERKENLIPLKGLPANPTQFLKDKWLPESSNPSEVYISRATLYKKQEQYSDKLNEVELLCKQVKEPKTIAKQLKASDDEITKLNIRLKNLAELNAQIEEEYQLKINELKSEIADLKEENERLVSIVENRSSNVRNLF